jgi:uncharacterized protein (TIGR03435 family)
MRTMFCVLLAVLGRIAAAQETASFEVASIKFHPGPITMSGGGIHGATLSDTALTLLNLTEDAYNLRRDQISGGPSWIDSDRYDVIAKAEGEGALAGDKAMQMLQALLADRFQLKLHRETRETPVYELVVGKNGPKLKASSADAKGRNFVSANSAGMHMEAANGTMERLARQLSVTAGRPVIDKTGLAGYYAFTLDWASAIQPTQPDSDIPSMFTAVQEQLGLKLESAKAPVEMLIVDRAEKPSEN